MRDEWAVTLKEALVERLPRGWRESAPWGYPQQAELAVIAGVFAAQVPQTTAEEVAAAYMMARPGRMLDDLSELAAIDAADLESMLGPSWGASRVLGVARSRAAVIVDAAGALVEHDVRTAAAFREAVAERGPEIDRALQHVRGLGGVSSEAISTMMQAEHRPGAVVVTFLRFLLGPAGSDLSTDDVMPLVRATARRLTVEPRVLLYALWRVVEVPAEPSGATEEELAESGEPAAVTRVDDHARSGEPVRP